MTSESDEITVEDDASDCLFSLTDWDEVEIEHEETDEADVIREIKDQTVSCEVCGKKLKNPATLRNHTSIMHTENKSGKLYQCELCNFSSHLYKTYKYHTQVHRTVTQTVCTICGVLVRNDNFNKHVAYHRQVPPVSCEICGKVLKNNIILKGHMRGHQNNPFQCAQCGKVYKYMRGYTAHMKRHAAGGNKTVACLICEKQFYDKKALTEHIRIHTGERPYRCLFCNNTFTSGYNLKSHHLQHTKQKAHSCDRCGMAFIHKVSLKSHIKSKHPAG